MARTVEILSGIIVVSAIILLGLDIITWEQFWILLSAGIALIGGRYIPVIEQRRLGGWFKAQERYLLRDKKFVSVTRDKDRLMIGVIPEFLESESGKLLKKAIAHFRGLDVELYPQEEVKEV